MRLRVQSPTPGFRSLDFETAPWFAPQGRLMAPPNVTWHSIIEQAKVSPDVLKQSEVVRNVQNILQTNMSVASSLGPPFLSQMRIIYEHMLTVYKCGSPPRLPPPRAELPII